MVVWSPSGCGGLGTTPIRVSEAASSACADRLVRGAGWRSGWRATASAGWGHALGDWVASLLLLQEWQWGHRVVAPMYERRAVCGSPAAGAASGPLAAGMQCALAGQQRATPTNTHATTHVSD